MQRTLLLITAFASLSSYGQNAAYSFTQTTEPYGVLTNDAMCTFDANGFDAISELNGETFTLFGVPFVVSAATPLRIGDFGFVRVDDATTSVIIDGLFTFNQPADATGYISYAITGTPGQYILTAQWHFLTFTNGPVGNFAMWQVKLEQATGIIEVRIGPNSGGGMIYTDATGPNCGVFHAPNTFTSCYAKVWVEQDAYDPIIDTLPNFDFDALHNLPPAHTVYRFTPQGWGVGVNEVPVAAQLQVQLDGDDLNVQLPEGTTAGTLLLVDAAGRTVRSIQVAGPQHRIRLDGLPTGAYALQLVRDSGTLTKRFVRP